MTDGFFFGIPPDTKTFLDAHLLPECNDVLLTRKQKKAITDKAYRERNKEKLQEKHRAYYQLNKEKKKAYQKAYYKENKFR